MNELVHSRRTTTRSAKPPAKETTRTNDPERTKANILEVAAAANDLPNRRFDERKLDETAELELKLPIAKIKAQIAEMGRAAGSPWRADEKAAATAAWLALAAAGRERSK